MADVAAPIIPTVLQTWHQGNLASVAASAVSTFEVRTGNNVHGLNLKFNSAVPAALTRAQLITDVAGVRAWLNGELIYDLTTTQNLDLYKYRWDKFGALVAPLGVLPIRFTTSGPIAFDQRRGFAIGMLKSTGKPGQGPYNVLTVEVTMTAGVATAAVGEIHIVSDMYAQEPTGLHVRTTRTTRDILAAGQNVINDLPRAAYGLLTAHIVTAQVMTYLDVIYDQSYFYRNVDGDGLAILQDEAGRTPQAGYSHIPFDLGNDLHSNLPYYGLASFEIRPTYGVAPGAGTPIILEEVWDRVRE